MGISRTWGSRKAAPDTLADEATASEGQNAEPIPDKGNLSKAHAAASEEPPQYESVVPSGSRDESNTLIPEMLSNVMVLHVNIDKSLYVRGVV